MIVCFDEFKSFKARESSIKQRNPMAGSCCNPFRLRKSKEKPLPIPSSSRTRFNSDSENMERKRFDSLESWSMILDSENVETWEASKEDQEEWTADLSQLFIGKVVRCLVFLSNYLLAPLTEAEEPIPNFLRVFIVISD